MKTSKRENRGLQAWIVLFVVIVVTSCAGNKILTRPSAPNQLIHYSELKGMDETRNLNNCVFYVNKGESIPLKLSMETDFMEFKQDQVDIIAKQRLYFMIKMPENLSANELAKLNQLDARSFSEMSGAQRAAFLKNYMLYVSKDAVRWAPLYGSRAYREVLGFKKGLLSFGILASTGDGLKASLDIRTVN